MRARHLPIELAVASLMLLVACTESTPPPRAAADQIEIMYLANEGFLLTSGDDKVLVDGLFREGGDYASLPLEWRETVETAQPPFDTVDVVLATHHHADHFHALAVCRFLDSNPLAEFVSTRQALDQMRSACGNPAALADRVKAGLLSDGSSATVVLGELRIESVFLHHGAASPVENIGFLIEIGGLTVLHMGDSQATAEDLRAAGLGERSIDLAFVPYWYLIDKRWTPAIELLQPGGIVVMHIPPPGSPLLESFQGWDALVRTIINRFQQAVVFAEPFETRTY
ncbi:MAG: MBL fold metallo-hydrolase [Acidobacteriota bacterium]